MFNNLLESKPQAQKRGGWTAGSSIIVGGLIALSAIATANAAVEEEKVKEEKIEFVEVKKEEPPPPPEPTPPPPDVVVAPPPPKGFQVLTAPVEIPDVIPDIDLTKKVTDENDFSGKGVAGGTSKGVAGGTAPATDQAYFEFQVEKTVVAAPGSCKPQYPDMLRSAGVSGEVLAQFIVGTDGRVEKGSFKALKTDNEQFTSAVRRALDCLKFLPAETGGRKVRQLVQQPFAFSVGS